MNAANSTQSSHLQGPAQAQAARAPAQRTTLSQGLVATANRPLDSAAGPASRHGSAGLSPGDQNTGDLDKSRGPCGLKGGMPVPPRKQKLQALRQEKEAARLAAAEFNENWGAELETLDAILKETPIRRIFLMLGGASKSQCLVGELDYAVNIHHGIRRLDFEDPKLCAASKLRDKIEEHLHELRSLDGTYQTISDSYKWLKHQYTQKLRDGLESNDLTRQLLIEDGAPVKINETVAAQSAVIIKIERFRDFLREEQIRLMDKLDELPSPTPDKSSVRTAGSSQMSKRFPGRAAPSKGKKAASATPSNRVSISTPADDDPNTVVTRTGKPRSDNADVVDILNSRGQRTATYIRSPNQQLFLKYSPADRSIGAATGAITASLSDLDEQVKHMLSEAAEAEKSVDYIRRQPGSSPRSAHDLLEYQANTLRTCAAEVDESKQGLRDAGEIERAGDMARSLRAKAAELADKGQRIRIEMILQAAPTPDHLVYLSDLGLLDITRTVSRKRGERMVFDPVVKKQLRQTDFLDEFEVKVNRQVWAYAHMHYPAADTPAEFFAKAHLKRPDQKGVTGEGIHYGTFYSSLFRKVFL